MIDDAILDVIDSVVQTPGVLLGWLTGWAANVSRFEQLLGGRLRQGFIVSEPSTLYSDPSQWKAKAVIRLARQYPGVPLCWVDDNAIPAGMLNGSLTHSLPGALLIAPNPEVGLTLTDARRIAEYFDKCSG